MLRSKNRQLWIPLIRLTAGSVIAVACGIGVNWKVALAVEVATLLGAYLLYALSADDTDIGALVGSRVDERQRLIRWKAASLSLVVALATMIVAGLIAAAVHAVFWPFVVVTAVIGVAYLVGLAVYGAGRP